MLRLAQSGSVILGHAPSLALLSSEPEMSFSGTA